MPGLVGYFGPPPGGDMPAHLEKMMSALEPDAIFQRQSYTDSEASLGLGRVTLGIFNPNPQPVWNPSRTRCIFFEGELFEKERLIKLLKDYDREPDSLDDAGLLLSLYDELGLACANHLNGGFISAIWEPDLQKLVLINDRMGQYALYYAYENNRFSFASGVRALLTDPGLPRQVDWLAMAEFLTFDHVLHDRTLLESIKLARQACVLIVDPAGLQSYCYFDYQYPEVYPHQSEAEYIHEYLYYLEQAVARQSQHTAPISILLSGGLDSRFILPYLVNHTNQSPVQAFTWGDADCDDAMYAREIALSLGVQHHLFNLSPDWLKDKAREAVRITDGMGNIVNLHAFATLDQETQHANVIIKGFLGDAMFGYAVQKRFWATYAPDIVPQVHFQLHTDQDVITFTPGQQVELFTDQFRAHVREGVMEEYIRGMNESGSKSLADQRVYFDFRQRVPRMTIKGVEVVRNRAMTRLPFADNDLVDFSLRLPPGLRQDRYLVRQAFVQTFPRLAQIPITPSGLPMVDCGREIRIRAGRLLRWHLVNRGLLKGPYIKSKPYANYNVWFRTNLRDWVEANLLSDRSLGRGYYAPQVIKRLVQAHMDGENLAVQLGALLSIELWHQLYLD